MSLRGATYRNFLTKAYRPSNRVVLHHARHVSWTAALLPTVTFSGLLGALWIYKCLVMVVLQNKIIYMPNLPPFSRSEKISDYKYPRDVFWREEKFRSFDGTKLSVAVGEVRQLEHSTSPSKQSNVVIYFQGQALTTLIERC